MPQWIAAVLLSIDLLRPKEVLRGDFTTLFKFLNRNFKKFKSFGFNKFKVSKKIIRHRTVTPAFLILSILCQQFHFSIGFSHSASNIYLWGHFDLLGLGKNHSHNMHCVTFYGRIKLHFRTQMVRDCSGISNE